jgi:replicative superfamily II helicase
MLQSRLNAGKGPALFLCPNNFLITQTCEQAKQFGIATCTADPDLPDEFSTGTRILVTSVQKLFNGLTKFGLHRQSVAVNTVLMDDAHACADIIREACQIRIPADQPAYDALRTLFADELEAQGVGTWADILNDKRDALLPVPYWAWMSREAEVARILSKQADRASVKFAWPLLKDMLGRCQCVFSGAAVEIEPHVAPLDAFGSYWKAERRVFMSATVTDDAFLVKGLQLTPETITNPLSDDKETWSGERMILLPSLIHEDLDREEIVAGLGKPRPKRRYGVVALAPSFARTKDWESYGATIAKTDSVGDVIESLKKGEFENTVVLVNRYDGIDLPDDTCRILVFDSRPYSENLSDLYQELCRPDSEATLMRTLRTIEQGMGRSVRGDKDYCVVVAIGTDLVRLMRDKTTRKYLSPQMAAQIDLGLEIASMAKQEIEDGEAPKRAFSGLVRQCLSRDADWKAFYVEQMDQVLPSGANKAVLRAYDAELKAEKAFAAGDYVVAADALQVLVNAGSVSADDKGWYLQEMARYKWRANRVESERLQVGKT